MRIRQRPPAPAEIGAPGQHAETRAGRVDQDAVEAAQRLQLPALFQERPAAALTGPASNLTGLYRAFAELAGRGWEMIAASIDSIEHGTPTAARFARASSLCLVRAIWLYTSRSPRRRARKNTFTFNDVALRL